MKSQKLFNQSSLLSIFFIVVTLVEYPLNHQTALAKSDRETCKPIQIITKILKKRNPNSSLITNRYSVSRDWKNAPQGNLLDISTTNSVYNTEFEMAYSKKIISQCSGIVAVRFGSTGTDAQAPYGLIKGRIKLFECPRGMGIDNHPSQWEWGYYCGA